MDDNRGCLDMVHMDMKSDILIRLHSLALFRDIYIQLQPNSVQYRETVYVYGIA